MSKANQAVKQDAVFWPSRIQCPHEKLHLDYVAKLMVRLQNNRRRMSETECENLTTVCNWLIEGLYQSYFALPRAPLALPLSKNAYGEKSIYNIPYSYRLVVKALKALEEFGFVDVSLGTFKVGGEGTLTRLRPAGRLLKHYEELGLRWRQVATPDRLSGIFLNPGKGRASRKVVTTQDAPNVTLMQDRLFKINDYLGKQCISIDLPNVAFKSRLYSKFDDQCGDEAFSSIPVISTSAKPSMAMQNVFLYRVFAQGSLTKGGRFYGGWWQQIPSRLRRRILINEDKTVECDFSGLSCAMLYAREGLCPPSDPYDIGLNFGNKDPRRALVKKYMNAMLNDSSKRYRLDGKELALLGLKHSELHASLCALHAPIKKYFNTGVGVDLQFHDSEMAQEVMLRLMERGEVCLPIHDSFIVRIQAAGLLLKTMHDVFQLRFSQSPGVKSDLGYQGVSMGRPSIQILSEKQLDIHEKIRAQIDQYSLIREYYLSWERTYFSSEEIALRCRAINLESSHLKESGLPALHLHKFYGLPFLISARL